MSLSQLEYNRSTFFYNEIMNAFKMDFSLYEDLVDILKPTSVLEIGCGMGRLFPIFMKEAKEITGVDLSDEMISKGKQHYASTDIEDITVDFVNANMCSFQLNKKYDLVVFALSVLKHLRSDEDRLKALQQAKEHLSDDGFIIIDHKPFLYSSKSTDWIDAKDSVVEMWVPDPTILEGYQWRKQVDGSKDVLQWRYNSSGEVQFETEFTTHQYDISTLIEHIRHLDMNYEHVLTEWGCNGLSKKGKRFIGFISHPSQENNPKQELVEKVMARREWLWSDHDLYQQDKAGLLST